MRKLAFVILAAWSAAAGADFQSRFPAAERPWAGPEYWANPLQDWRVKDGRLECIAAGGDRNVFLLTREVENKPGTLAMSVKLGLMEGTRPKEGFAGFRLGVHGAFKEYRDSAVRGYGLNAGVRADGRLFIGRAEDNAPRVALENLELRIETRGDDLVLAAFDASGKKLGEVTRRGVRPPVLAGGLALVSHYGHVEETPGDEPQIIETGWADKRLTQRGGTVRFWFRDWKVSGTRVSAHEDRVFGPILFTQHTLSLGGLKLTAQMAPLVGPQQASLQVRQGSGWRTVATASMDAMARTVTFRVPKWNDKQDTPYRVAFRLEGREHYWGGAIRRDPVDKPQIVVAAFTGNNDLGFPHADVVQHVSYFKPDLLVYTGDQIYERVGEYGIQREPMATATLDYLRKWYIFGWEYRDLLKDIPSVCLPDDHDVYHGNLWGAGGPHAEGTGYEGQDKGGYTMPAAWVNMVQRTQTSHMADPYDPTPIQQGITVYYGPMMLGGISFAVVEDRKWKSAPKPTLPKAQIINGFPQNPNWKGTDGDVPGAELLGKRQEDFLAKWVQDWSHNAWMKSLITQTLFATVATLPKDSRGDSITTKLRVMQPGEYAQNDAPTMDHDSNGWPQTPRTRALRTLRRGFTFHITGDQHLGSTIQYGIDKWSDGPWAICVPSVANIFPRRWFPPEPGRNAKPGAPKNTGEFTDGFGNKITVHAVSNPVAVGVQPKALHERAPGYGIVTFERATRKIAVANWPRWVDPAQPGAKPYPGWPIVIDQVDNGMPHEGWTLGRIETGLTDPVVQVIDQANSEVVYTIRIKGGAFEPKVFKGGTYTVKADGK